MYPRLASNSWQISCLGLQSAEITGMNHHTQPVIKILRTECLLSLLRFSHWKCYPCYVEMHSSFEALYCSSASARLSTLAFWGSMDPESALSAAFWETPLVGVMDEGTQAAGVREIFYPMFFLFLISLLVPGQCYPSNICNCREVADPTRTVFSCHQIHLVMTF